MHAYPLYTACRAIENTARPIPDMEIFASGRGLIQINKAYELVVEWHQREQAKSKLSPTPKLSDYYFDVKVPRRANARGIYLRELADTHCGLVRAGVSVTPVFLSESAEFNAQKVCSNVRVRAYVHEQHITDYSTAWSRPFWNSNWH
jgi:hypothetical protein